MFHGGKSRQNGAGFTLIEVMMAGALLSFIAIALMPAVFSLVDSNKTTGFRAQCAGIVRAKLQEYMNGVADSSMDNGQSSHYVPTGFEYTKKRYQSYQTSCSLTPSAGSPGFREAVFSNALMNAQETALPRDLLGFQLWVMIRHYNPRVQTQGQPSRACPPSTYQFYQVGDALEVTVTGMIRVRGDISAGGRGNAKWGKLDDADDFSPNPRLTCSASGVVYPPRIPFRYYLSGDGKLRNYQATIAFTSSAPGASAEAMESQFRSIWMNGTTTMGNIRGVAVSPDNKWVYVMRPGELARYGPCFDDGTGGVGGTVTIGAYSFPGTPDCPSVPETTWASDLNIENITVDFGDLTKTTDDKVYGFYNTGSGTNSSGKGGLMLGTLSASAPYTVTWSDSSTFSLPANRPRIKGIFIAQTFPSVSAPNLYFFDNTCFTGGSTSESEYNYCLSLFSSADSSMAQEMRELPTQTEAISY